MAPTNSETATSHEGKAAAGKAVINIGPKSRAWLAEIGITDDETIRRLGAVEVYCRLKFRFGRAISRNMLHALAAGLIGIDWRDLSPDHKADLDAAVAARMALAASGNDA